MSSCPADYLKGQPPVVALPDDQLPPWLWTSLKLKVYPDDGPGGSNEKETGEREEDKGEELHVNASIVSLPP